MADAGSPRTFKTAWFSKAAHKARITDEELCKAIEQVRHGQADDLGGGVFKKRLDRNRSRSIVVAKGQQYWVYAYLFAKKDKRNISPVELVSFRDLADLYQQKTDAEIARDCAVGELMEICNAD